jgi:hypothetical protein
MLPHAGKVWAALTFFANFMTQGTGSLAIKNVLPCTHKIFDWCIRCQHQFLGRVLAQLWDTVADIQKESNGYDINAKTFRNVLMPALS